MNMNVASNLKRRRFDKKLSVTELCSIVGIDEALYQQVENGTANPTVEMLEKLAEFYGISMADFLNESTTKTTVVDGSSSSSTSSSNNISSKKIWLVLNGIFMLIVGIALCVSLVGILPGVFAIIGGAKMLKINKMSDVEAAQAIANRQGFGYTIYSIFITGIIGILALIFVYMQQ